MKKLLTLMLVVLATGIFAADWYSTKELITDLKPMEASKDTAWYGYQNPGLVWTISAERATYFDLKELGLEAPVALHGITSYLYDDGYTYSYKVYDKDGSTILFQSPDSISEVNYCDFYFEPDSMVIFDDFYISVVPESGLPRQVTSDALTSSHSYYGSAGNWSPLEDSDGFYENIIYAYIAPFNGTDIVAPRLTEVIGSQAFMNFDLKIAIEAQDLNAIVDPVVGEFTIDDGMTWTPFNLNAVTKAYTTFEGVIPGQNDGITGTMRFTLVDDQGNTTLTDEYPISWTKDLPMLIEDFEGDVFPPEDWTLDTAPTGAGWIKKSDDPLLEDVHGGLYSAAHMADNGDQNDWLITPALVIPADNSATLSFWQAGNWTDYIVYHGVEVTTDGGSTWTPVYVDDQPMPNADVPEGSWSQEIIPLSAYAGQTIQIGWNYQGNYSDMWFIDDIEVLYDYKAPEIVDIVGNEALRPNIGAYLNNDLTISITAYDLSGVQSIVGHYSINGGATIDLPFAASKRGNEIWTATIPAESATATGTINFDLTDDAGISTTTADYDLEFVLDTESAVITKFEYGNPLFINEDMNLSLTFTDESAITSCVAYYSEDNFVTSTPYSMAPSKVHEYNYTGVIPAKTVETFGEVLFTIADAEGNVTNSQEYTVGWYEGGDIFFDDFDANHDPANWTFEGDWGLTEEDAVSPTHSLADSPGGIYLANRTVSATSKVLDFSLVKSAMLYFYANAEIEAGWDSCYVDITRDSVWTPIHGISSEGEGWQYIELDIGGLAESPTARFRFRFFTDAYEERDGIYIDDVKITAFTKDHSAPSPVAETPPSFVGSADYTFDVEWTDVSDILDNTLYYSIDGAPYVSVSGTPASGTSGTYSYTIPVQTSMTSVDYYVEATDNSEFNNVGKTKTYTMRFGNFLYYENGGQYIDYLDVIGPSGSALAVAKRITMGPGPDGTKDHYMADLVGFTIDNYINLPDYPSAPMNIHVWADTGNGPGADLITPFVMDQASTPEDSYAITYVDLRPYAAELSNIEGDVYVGFTSTGDATNILYEVVANYVSEPGYTAFERSWLGTGSIDALEWSLDAASVYHMSAVIGSYSLVDTPLAPQGVQIRGGEGNMILDWYAVADEDITHYNIYRGDAAGFPLGTPIGNTSELTYVDSTCALNTVYYYKITAVDAGGQESAPSVEVSENSSAIDGNIPMVTSLSQNYPNPFNPVTTINFSTAVEGNVSLTVYNTAGAVVAKLVDGKMGVGYHSVPFDGSNLVSGVYYYTMQLNDKVFTHKMMLIK